MGWPGPFAVWGCVIEPTRLLAHYLCMALDLKISLDDKTIRALLHHSGHADILAAIAALAGKIDAKMSELTDAIAELTQKVADEDTEIDSALALIAGIPAVVAAAVADALANAGVDTAAATAAVKAASATVQGETDKIKAALTTPPAP